MPDLPCSLGKASKPKTEVGVQPVRAGTGPLGPASEGPSVSEHGPSSDWLSEGKVAVGVPSLCWGILEAELLTFHPSSCWSGKVKVPIP